MSEKSYFVIDSNGDKVLRTDGPFDTEKEAQDRVDLISSVKRIGYLVIAECDRIAEVESF